MQTVTDDDKKINRHGLGRGLDSLIPTGKDNDESPKAEELMDLNEIAQNPKQPRQNFEEVALAELASSIREHGIIQPLLVSPHEGKFQLIAGERRYRAARIAGLTKVPVIIRTMDEQSKLEVALIENVQRENLNPIESANSYKRLIDEFSLTQEEVAKKVGKARPTIANALRLLALPSEIKQALINGEITEGHARTLLNIDDSEKQLELFREIKAGKVTVRQAESKKPNSKRNRDSEIKKDPNFEAAEKRIGEKMATKVIIKKKKNGGQIVIEYYSFEDLERIYRRLISF